MNQAQVESPNFNPGGRLDAPDERKLKWESIGAALPPFNWEQGFDIEQTLSGILSENGFKLPVKDQNGSGSCGGQETSQYVGVQEAVATKSFEERSAKDVIAQTYILSPTGEMLGSTFRDNSNHAVNNGVAREIICPSYDNGNPPTDAFMNRRQDITEAVKADEKNAKEKSYAYVNISIDDFAQAAAANYGLGFLIRGSNNGTWWTPNPKPGYNNWGHFMYAGKFMMRNGKKVMKAINSWGKNCGEDGWQYFGEDWFQSGQLIQARTFVFDSAIPIPPRYTFTRDLTIGNSGIDVRFLQNFLNTHGSPVAYSGPGSLGQETSYFGKMTQMALAKWQRNNAVSPAFGYFGPITRKKINLMPW